jgi:hypothetical protein
MTGLHIWNVSILHSSKVSLRWINPRDEKQERAFRESLFMARGRQPKSSIATPDLFRHRHAIIFGNRLANEYFCKHEFLKVRPIDKRPQGIFAAAIKPVPLHSRVTSIFPPI